MAILTQEVIIQNMSSILDKYLRRLTEKRQQLDRHKPLQVALTDNLNQWFRIELTYTSSAIEGNTLSRQETALVVEKGITVEGKSIREHLEAQNHARAWDYLQTFVNKKITDINETLVLDLQRMILSKIDDTNAGRYRNVAVRIAGSTVILPNPVKVPQLMEEFIVWLHKQSQDHPVKLAADAHLKFESIHPFVDGNGRVGRLLLNLILMQAGYPPALIRPEDRKDYITSLEEGQLSGNLDKFYEVIYQAVERSLDIYLESVEPKAD